MSKSYNMAGWRIGFAVGNKTLIAAMSRVKSYLDYGAFTPIQAAACAALNGPQDIVETNRQLYHKRRDVLAKAVKGTQISVFVGVLAALVGLPGLGFYLLARGLGINTTIAAANLAAAWWTVPVLVLSAVGNAVLEEVVVVGYLYARLGQVGWGMPATMAASAVLRGAYHLYQGFGGFLGNVVMGLVFGAAYRRWGRVMPLVVAHTLLDVVAFVGYSLLRGHVGWL